VTIASPQRTFTNMPSIIFGLTGPKTPSNSRIFNTEFPEPPAAAIRIDVPNLAKRVFGKTGAGGLPTAQEQDSNPWFLGFGRG
jgi:hypothetical protein